MDMCFTSKSKNEVTSNDPGLIKIHSDEKAQKENTAFRHNNNAHLTHTSFIPVYTKKSNVCHYFSDKGDENKSSSIHHGDQDKNIKSSNSLVSRQKYLADQNEKVSFRSVRTHIRRRSVGFEDMTSFNSGYFSKEKRNEAVIKNSIVSTASDNTCGKALNSDNEFSYAQELTNHKENISSTTGYNQNSEVLKNANDQILESGKPYQHYKDKSSKRKSSLNRMDFIDFPASHAGNSFSKKSYQSKESSSDEEIDSKPKQNSELLTINSKRKHVSPGTESACNSFPKTSSDIPCQHIIPVNKMKLLPKSFNSPHFKPKQYRKSHLANMQIQKLSHSAGELESLTDETTGTNKVCLSAQEFDICDSLSVCARLKTHTGSQFKKHHSQLPPVVSFNSKNSNHQDASQTKDFQNFKTYSNSAAENVDDIRTEEAHQFNCNSTENVAEEKNSGLNTLVRDEPILSCMNLNDSFELKHIDSKSEDDLDGSTTKIHNLKISDEKGIENSEKLTDDNCDSVGSDGERRPSSILRKKYFEERKELHGILKPPPDDKMSVAPPSILKHRESSEEKDVWQQPDLHSILKKSTSEDESCNSGSDIRPILKVSTDEESPGGSSRPRPILKKRTSFSEECSYASYPNGELKPILKKKTLPLLASDDQPRPILKSRRKSEDAHSTLSEIIASRPRAYSADMGVKSSHENRLDGLEQNKEFSKIENQDL